jgi:hypothetical protein
MTIAQFAIARVFNQLRADIGKRDLTAAEWRLLANLRPAMARLEEQEAPAAGAAAEDSPATANGRTGVTSRGR